MASSTTNLDLILPVGGENVSRQIINANNVKIDEAVGPVPSGTDLQSQVTALNNNIAHQQKYQIGDTFNFDAAQFSFRTLGNLSGIYFRYRLPKPVADNVTSFTVTITVQSPCWSNCGVATIPVNATVSNIGILDKRTISFSVVPSETIANSGFGVSELNADITFT